MQDAHPSLGGESLDPVRDGDGAVLIAHYEVTALEGGGLNSGTLNVGSNKLEPAAH